jgi:hypothetical protein
MGLVATPAAWRMVGICIIAVTLLRVYSIQKYVAAATWQEFPTRIFVKDNTTIKKGSRCAMSLSSVACQRSMLILIVSQFAFK